MTGMIGLVKMADMSNDRATAKDQAISTIRSNANFPGYKNRVVSHTHRVWNHVCEHPSGPNCSDCMFLTGSGEEIDDPMIQQRRKRSLTEHKAVVRLRSRQYGITVYRRIEAERKRHHGEDD